MESSAENPLLKVLGRCEFALQENDLKTAYVRGRYGNPKDFNNYVKDLEKRGMSRNKGSVVEENAGGNCHTYGPRELLFFMDDDQLRNWYFMQVEEANSVHSIKKKKTSDKKVAGFLELCDRERLRPKEGAKKAKIGQFVAEKAYSIWNFIPTYLFEGVFDSEKTFSDIHSKIESRLEDSVPPHILHRKLKYLVLLGRCGKTVAAGKTLYGPAAFQKRAVPS